MLAIQVDKRPISQAQLIGFLAMIGIQLFVAGGVWYKFQTLADDAATKADLAALAVKVDTQEISRKARSDQSDRNFDDIQKQLKPLDTVTLRLDQNDKRDDAQDARLDRLMEFFGNKFDALTQSVVDTKTAVGEVKADVRVLAQDVKSLAGKTQPTTYRP